MKIFLNKKGSSRGFTLTEVLVASSLLTVVMAGMVTSHIVGMKMMQITKAKLGASDEARKSITKLTEEVRGAKWLQVGVMRNGMFTPVQDGERQEGEALEIYSTPSTNEFIRYYRDSNDNNLKRVTKTMMTPVPIAHSLTNTIVFACENSAGEVLMENENNRVLALTLQFYQIQYPIVKIGPGQHYDFYQLRRRITRRNLE
ncbi:MAG: PilW family protein [Limisphaerales bacterium]